MKKTTLAFITLCTASVFTISSCNKDDDDSNQVDVATLKADILSNTAKNVIELSYSDMLAKVTTFKADVATLVATPDETKLATARADWKAIRATWEQSEAWLFGPVASDDIDPRIDTWPVDFNSINLLLASGQALDASYFSALDNVLETGTEEQGDAANAMRGFHPTEFLLWGENGDKTATQLAADTRGKQFLTALTENLFTLTTSVHASWTSGYTNKLVTAGAAGNDAFPTQLAAFSDIVDAMQGICAEVGEGKMGEPFDAQDPELEESPYSKNSIIDFTNNIQGIMNIYQGKFGSADGKGLEDLVQVYNKSLDLDIKTKHAAAIAALKAITKPFGEAILTTGGQATLVQNAIDKIEELAAVLNDGTDGNGKDLKDFVLQYGK